MVSYMYKIMNIWPNRSIQFDIVAEKALYALLILTKGAFNCPL